MESYYTWENYFRISAAVALLLVLVPALFLVISGVWRRVLFLPALLLIVLFALIPVTPFSGLEDLFKGAALVLGLLALPSVFIFARRLGQGEMRDYRGWIIDSLRESVLIFDSSLALQDSSGPVTQLSGGSSSALLEELRGLIKKEGRGESMVRFEDKIYRSRFRPLEGGWLLTLHDLTEEQRLLDELLEKNRQLEGQRRLLRATEGVEFSMRKEEFRQRVTGDIQGLVHRTLQQLMALLESSGETDAALIHAEKAMADIRAAVGHLNEQGRTR